MLNSQPNASATLGILSHAKCTRYLMPNILRPNRHHILDSMRIKYLMPNARHPLVLRPPLPTRVVTHPSEPTNTFAMHAFAIPDTHLH
jgi:hypothetical protein